MEHKRNLKRKGKDSEFTVNQSDGVEKKKKSKKKSKKKAKVKEHDNFVVDQSPDVEKKKKKAKVEEHDNVVFDQSAGVEMKTESKKKVKVEEHDKIVSGNYDVAGDEECINAESDEEKHIDLEEDEHLGVMSEKDRPKSDQYEGQYPKKKKKREKEKTEKNVESSENNNGNMSAKKKKVSFQDQVMEERKNIQEENAKGDDTDDLDIQEEYGEQVWGHRFTREENATLRRAVFDYIRRKGWEKKEGLEKVLNCKKYREARGCWGEINACLPHRPRKAIRFRAHMMLDPGSLLGRWSKEEEETLRSLYEKHGRKWKEFIEVIGRSRMCIKEKWRTMKRKKATGVWTQDELQRLSDMVHKCYRVKALLGPRISNDRHLLRDDLNWEKIADDIETHGHGACASKWYYHLTSSMVQEGIWANEDDYLLLKGLLESGACDEEEVDWESVLEHRSGQVSMQRWKQMCKYLGENRTKAFLDKLDILVQRYAPELLDKSTDKPDNATVNDA